LSIDYSIENQSSRPEDIRRGIELLTRCHSVRTLKLPFSPVMKLRSDEWSDLAERMQLTSLDISCHEDALTFLDVVPKIPTLTRLTLVVMNSSAQLDFIA
jgi:hypothetical protein